MPEASGQAHSGEASAKTYTFPEKDNGAAAPARSDHKAAATDTTRTTALKARKRTKTGCLSKSITWLESGFRDD